MDLNGKVVLVAGGAGGVGLGIAKALAAGGCKVALADSNEEVLADAVKAVEGAPISQKKQQNGNPS
jgi:NAD(P)-dependent dehydrogenase (short-subunit alcohol dehydrogenase family)